MVTFSPSIAASDALLTGRLVTAMLIFCAMAITEEIRQIATNKQALMLRRPG